MSLSVDRCDVKAVTTESPVISMLITGVNSTPPKLSPWTCIYEVIPDFKSMPSVPHGQNTNHRITNKSHLSWHTSFAGIGSRTKMKLNEWNARMNKNNNNNNYTALFFTLSLALFFLFFFRKKKEAQCVTTHQSHMSTSGWIFVDLFVLCTIQTQKGSYLF